MDMIARLRAERQGLVGRLSEIDKILTQYEQIERAAQQLLGGGPPLDSPTLTAEPAKHIAPPTSVASSDRSLSSKNKTPIEEFEQAVIDVLRETAAPMDRAQIYDALTERGVVIGDGDRDKELNALSARVYRMTQAGRLMSRRGQGYSLNIEDDLEGGAPEDEHESVSEQQDEQQDEHQEAEQVSAVNDDDLLG